MYQWGQTALVLAGFTPDDAGLHRLSLNATQEAQNALSSLQRTAADLGVRVVTSPHRFIGDIASATAAHLPGNWEATVEPVTQKSDQDEFASWLWGAKALVTCLADFRVPCVATLHDGAGIELLVVQRPSDGAYLTGALTPTRSSLSSIGPGPRCVTATTAAALPSNIHSSLLPQYERAVLLARLEEVDEDLRWVQDLEPGTASDIELSIALSRFQSHAPALINAMRSVKAASLTAVQTELLRRVEATLDRAGKRSTAADEAMAAWLSDGPGLVKLARAVATPPTTSSHTDLPASMPPPPPAATISADLRR